MIAALRRIDIWTVVLAAAHAVLFIVAFAPMNFWPLILLAPVLLALLALRAPSTKQALLVALVVQTLMWLWISRWLWQITEAGFVPYGLVLGGWSALLVWVLRGAALHDVLGRVPLMLTLPVVWAGMEFFRGELLFDGYPWFLLGHPLVEWPMVAQSADLFGTYWLSFFSAMVAGCVADIARLAGFGGGAAALSRRVVIVGASAVVLVVGANVGYGLWRMNQQAPLSPGPTLLVIQTNLPQDNKMRSTPEEHWAHFQEFEALTVEAYEAAVSAGRKVDLIVWPETMVMGWGFEPQTVQFFKERDYWPGYRFAMAIEVLATELGVPMLVGSPAVVGVRIEPPHELAWEGHYNAAYLVELGQEGQEFGQREYQRYDKVFLTPFGETMPYIRAWPWLQEKLLAIGARGMRFDLQPGSEPRVLEFAWGGEQLGLATPICFEATMGGVIRSLVYEAGSKRADVMVNLTNDGWFGFHDPGRVQHAQIARLRAIENRVPLVRSANTGVSVSIGSSGQVVGRIGEGGYGDAQQTGALVAQVMLDARQTIYGRIGDVWGWVCLGLVMMSAVFVTVFKRR